MPASASGVGGDGGGSAGGGDAAAPAAVPAELERQKTPLAAIGAAVAPAARRRGRCRTVRLGVGTRRDARGVAAGRRCRGPKVGAPQRPARGGSCDRAAAAREPYAYRQGRQSTMRRRRAPPTDAVTRKTSRTAGAVTARRQLPSAPQWRR